MFDQTFVSGDSRSSRSWTLMASLALQSSLVLTALLIPLLRPELLPRASLMDRLIAPPRPPAAPPPPSVRIVEARFVPRQFDGARLLAPTKIPEKIAMIEESQLPTFDGVAGGMTGLTFGSALDGVIGAIVDTANRFAPPPQPPVKTQPASDEPAAPARYEVGGQVQMARLIRRVEPVYPPLARAARISGVVRLRGIIGIDGRIQNLEVLGGHPLLTSAALEAVRQWVYEPTLLNGRPVEVVAPIDVIFKMGQ